MLKIAGSNIYAHCSNFEEWHEKCIQFMDAESFDNLYNQAILYYEDMIDEPQYVLKFEKTVKSISVISTPDWDIRHEPTIGHSIYAKYDKDSGEVVCHTVTSKNQIYHHKWQFVQPTYTGFDVKRSMLRTVQCRRIPNIKNLTSQIGHRNFWNQLLKENNLPL